MYTYVHIWLEHQDGFTTLNYNNFAIMLHIIIYNACIKRNLKVCSRAF